MRHKIFYEPVNRSFCGTMFQVKIKVLLLFNPIKWRAWVIYSRLKEGEKAWEIRDKSLGFFYSNLSANTSNKAPTPINQCVRAFSLPVLWTCVCEDIRTDMGFRIFLASGETETRFTDGKLTNSWRGWCFPWSSKCYLPFSHPHRIKWKKKIISKLIAFLRKH